MNKISVCFITFCFIFGCASVKKVAVIEQGKDIRISAHESGSLLIDLQTPSFEGSKKGRIVSSVSYAIDSDGNKHNLTSESFQYAHDYPKPKAYTSYLVWLKKPYDKVRTNWYNSVWSIHVVHKSERGFEVFETTIELNDG